MSLQCPHTHVEAGRLARPVSGREEGTCRLCGANVWRIPAGRWRTDRRSAREHAEAEQAYRSEVMVEAQRFGARDPR